MRGWPKCEVHLPGRLGLLELEIERNYSISMPPKHGLNALFKVTAFAALFAYGLGVARADSQTGAHDPMAMRLSFFKPYGRSKNNVGST
jgi:hypothetical protein